MSSNHKLLDSLDKLEHQLDQLLAFPESFDRLWDKLDNNGNGIVSLAEIDAFAIYTYPLLNKKPALMRAYKKTVERDADEFVHKNEFLNLITNLFYFNRIYYVFNEIDTDGDHRIDLNEFKQSFSLLKLGRCKAETVFKEIDTNNGGYILFDEFCQWFSSHSLSNIH